MIRNSSILVNCSPMHMRLPKNEMKCCLENLQSLVNSTDCVVLIAML